MDVSIVAENRRGDPSTASRPFRHAGTKKKADSPLRRTTFVVEKTPASAGEPDFRTGVQNAKA
jgi:hypothetical protein